MGRVIVPARSELANLPTPLTDGEREVLDFFDHHLPPPWEIYVKPPLNGLRPDFALLNPNAGIAVYHVTSEPRPTRGHRWHWPREANGWPKLLVPKVSGKTFYAPPDPIARIARCRSAIAHDYCPEIGARASSNPRALSAITAGVILLGWSTEEAAQFYLPARESRHMCGSGAEKYYPVVGLDALRENRLDLVFPDAHRRASAWMRPEYADGFRSWLIESDASSMRRQPLQLDARQREIANTRTATGYRRVRGAAGSGKSVALAARAAQLTSEGRRVLVVTYNITLWHMLHDLSLRYDIDGRRITDNAEFIHFHSLCHRLSILADLHAEYREVLEARPDRGDCTAFEVDIVELALGAVETLRENGTLTPHQFDAILVDEGQDFAPPWWQLLRSLLLPGGEMLLVADQAQDTYGRGRDWTDDEMSNAGFRGPWTELGPSYRTPPDLVPYLQRFLADYDSVPPESVPRAAQMSLPGFCNLRWVQTSQAQRLPELCVSELVELTGTARLAPLSWSDLNLLTRSHRLGLQCVDLLAQRGLTVCHVFSEDATTQRQRKLAFNASDAGIKGCTIHSFKGWEGRAIVVALDSADRALRRLAYVAMSRLKSHELGSYLTVVCSVPELQDFGRTWPDYADDPPLLEEVTPARCV